jgi:hypothetical protein
MDPGEAPGTSGDPPDPPEPMLAHGGEDFGQDLKGGKKRRAPPHTAIDPINLTVQQPRKQRQATLMML